MPDRGQLSVPLLEAAIGAALILIVASLVVLATPAADNGQANRFDDYATDIGRLLVAGSGPQPPLVTVLGSATTYHRYETEIERSVEQSLPNGVYYRIETEYGVLGYPRPATSTTGHEVTQTVNGSVSVWVWSA